jgi:hypothetical protein
MRTTQGTIDLYHASPLPQVDKVVVFTENEYGLGSLLAVSSIIGEREPDAVALSHLLAEMGFNAAPDMKPIGWEIFFEQTTNGANIAYVMLTNWPNIQLFPPDATKSTWIYTYPVVRDFVELMKTLGATDLRFLSSTTIHEALDPDTFEVLSPKKAKTYTFGSKTNKKYNLFLTPPTWLFPYLAHNMDYEHSQIIMSGCDNEAEIDEEAGWTLTKHLSKIMEYSIPKKHYNKVVTRYKEDAEKQAQAERELVEALKAHEQTINSSPSEHMWG